MSGSPLLRKLAVLFVLILPFILFIYFEKNKPVSPKHLAVYGEVPYFQLIDQYGDTISSDDLKGYMYVSDFFFTHCPSVCPKLSTILAGIQKSYKDEQKVKLVSFTVDPMRDSISVLQTYAAKYEAAPMKWFFLTGNKDSIYHLAEKGFKIPVVQDVGGEEQFTHSDRVILVDASGKIRGYFNVAGDSTQVDSLYNNMERLLVEKPI